MKKYTIIIVALLLGCGSVKAQLSSKEKDELTPLQRSIYEKQSAEIKEALKAAEYKLFKAEDIIKMGKEMQADDADKAAAAHIARGVAMKEEALEAIAEEKNKQVLLDRAAREAIKNNKSN